MSELNIRAFAERYSPATWDELAMYEMNVNDLRALAADWLRLTAARGADRQHVKVHIGDSALSRDLVWCGCGRGLSRTGNWIFCPKCGSEIDQSSYIAACVEAEKNGAGHFSFHDADLLNEIAQQGREIDELKTCNAPLYSDRIKNLESTIEKRDAEIAGLREALGKITDGLMVATGRLRRGYGDLHPGIPVYCDSFGCLARDARAALAAVQPAPASEELLSDENGDCPNCANPPHNGPCRRKRTVPPVPATESERREQAISFAYGNIEMDGSKASPQKGECDAVSVCWRCCRAHMTLPALVRSHGNRTGLMATTARAVDQDNRAATITAA